jgi:hypothetical protein
MRRIRLERTYRNAGNVRIPSGDYWEDDAALNGLGAYLIDTRHAEVLSDTKDIEVIGVDWAETKPGIEDLTLAELKEEATTRGLPFNSRVTKAELIALIGDSAAVSEPEADETDASVETDEAGNEADDDEAT